MFLRNSRFPNSMIDRIFTQHPTICVECGGSMKRVKGKGISKKLPPCIQKNVSGGREIAGMESLGSKWNNKEKQPKPIIFIRFSTLIYFQIYTN